MTETQLQQLSKMTIVVADTGVIEEIKKHKPTDSTTNPSLVLKALNALKSDDEKENKEYNDLLKIAVDYVNSKCDDNVSLKDKLALGVDRLSVEFGKRILAEIPGYVSTELDARLSFDVENSVKRAVNIIKMYEELGIKNAKDRVLIKAATTYEGVQIAKILREKYEIKCNMTLLFSIYQAAAAAQIANAFLISPFVGRISDYNKDKEYLALIKDAKDKNSVSIPSYDAFKNDPGVTSVKNIYGYYKRIGATTIVMGASFRSKEQILALAGCDRLTIGPKYLKQLNESNDKIKPQLIDNGDKTETIYCDKLDVSEPNYRFEMSKDDMATFKLAEGIRKFAADIVKVEAILQPLLEKASGSSQSSQSRPGGAKKADNSEIFDVCNNIKSAVEAQANKDGQKGFDIFEGVEGTKQVVAGIMYEIKVKVGENRFIKIKVFRSLPPVKYELKSVQYL